MDTLRRALRALPLAQGARLRREDISAMRKGFGGHVEPTKKG
jgi:hypothetical protein